MDNSLTINGQALGFEQLRSYNVMHREISINESYRRQDDSNLILKLEKSSREKVVQQYKSDIINIIRNDVFEAGFVSQSENYIINIADEDNNEYIREAANELYLDLAPS